MSQIDLRKILQNYKNIIYENKKLKEENQILSKKLEISEEARKSALNYYRETQLMLEINSRLTAQTGNNDMNISLALTTLAGYLNADYVSLLKQDENGKFKTKNSSFKYYDKEKDNAVYKDLDIMSIIPGLTQLVIQDTLTEVDDVTIKVDNEDQIIFDKIALAPIIQNGKTKYILCSYNHKRDSQLLKYVATFFAETIDRIEKEELIHQMSITDKFTGLYDRDYFTEYTTNLPKELLMSLGVIEVDVNSLKFINDTYGHDVGDTYIKSIASIIHEEFLDDAAFRIGGDEFVIICKNKPKEYIELSINNIHERIKRLSIWHESGNISDLSASIGFSYTKDKIDFTRLYKEADENMYAQKRQFYEDKKKASK